VIRSMAVFVAQGLALWCGLSARAAERTVAVFGFELVDTRLQGATYTQEFWSPALNCLATNRLLGPGDL